MHNKTCIGLELKFNLFLVDTRGAGEGHLTVKVKDHVATYDALIKTKSPGQHSVSFDPRETGPHNICVFFDGQPVPGEDVFSFKI